MGLPRVRVPGRVLLGVVLERLQKGATFVFGHPFDVRRSIEIEVEGGVAGHRMGAHDRVRHVDERFERSPRGDAWRNAPRLL